CGWPRQRKACLRHVDVKPSLAWLAALEAAHCRLFERGKQAQELLLLQSRTFPIREMDEPGSRINEVILAMIREQDHARRQRARGLRRQGRNFLHLEFLGPGMSRRAYHRRQNSTKCNAQHSHLKSFSRSTLAVQPQYQ